MPLLIGANSKYQIVPSLEFANEKELEELLRTNPDLLRDDATANQKGGATSTIRWVASQVNLGEAGILDLLFVDGEGTPIAVEVKLSANDEARRKVVAQALDYLSALSGRTVDEINAIVDDGLDEALKEIAGGNDSKYDHLWTSFGTKLRGGRTRLIVALDDAPQSLDRIFQFLAQFAKLDVRLLTVRQHKFDAGQIVASQSRVNSRSEPSNGETASAPMTEELSAAVRAYNASPLQDLRAEGNASRYRDIHPGGGTPAQRYLYRFSQKATAIRVTLYLYSEMLAESIKPLVGQTIAEGQGTLAWHDSPMTNSWRLLANLPMTLPAENIAQAMRDLMPMTMPIIAEKLNSLSATQAVR